MIAKYTGLRMPQTQSHPRISKYTEPFGNQLDLYNTLQRLQFVGDFGMDSQQILAHAWNKPTVEMPFKTV